MTTRPSRILFLPAASTTVGDEKFEITQNGVPVRVGLSGNFSLAGGILDVAGVPVPSLADIAGLGGPALTDLDTVDRGGVDYKVTAAARAALFRQTPAGDRVWTMQSGTATNAGPTLTLTAADHDKEVVVQGSFVGTITADNTISAAGFRTFVTNEGSATQNLSPSITELTGLITLGPAKSARVYFSNSTLKCFISGGGAAAATAYTTAVSPAGSVPIGSPATVTYSPNGQWQAGQTITPATTGTLAGVFATVTNGSLSGGVITPTAGNGLAVTIKWTPNAGTSGTSGTINSTAASLTNTTGATNYSVTAATATAFTTALTRSGSAVSSGVVNQATTATFTPNANWPGGEQLNLILNNLTGAWSNPVGGTLAGSLLTPNAGSAAVSADFTPNAANSGTIDAQTQAGAVLTDTSGPQSYAALAAATAFTTAPTTMTVGSGQPSGNITFATTAGAWPVGSAIPITLTTVAGTINAVSGCTISGSGANWTVTPNIGTTTNAVITFTPSSSNGTNGSLGIAGTNITANNTSVSITVQSSVPSFPTLPGTGINGLTISVLARWKADGGVSLSGGSGTITDQSGNSNTLAPTVGVSVGANVGSLNLPSIAFANTSMASNSGALITGVNTTTGFLVSALASLNWTTYAFFKTGTVFNVDETIFMNGISGTAAVQVLWIDHTTGHLLWQDRGCASYTTLDLGALSANTTYRFMARMHYANPGDTPPTLDVWLNGTKTQYMQPASVSYAGMNCLAYGQGIPGWSGWGLKDHLWTEGGYIKGALPDANMTGTGSLDAYGSSKWT